MIKKEDVYMEILINNLDELKTILKEMKIILKKLSEFKFELNYGKILSSKKEVDVTSLELIRNVQQATGDKPLDV